MATTTPPADQYIRFGTFGQPTLTTMSGRRGGTIESETGATLIVKNFSAGNLSGVLYQGTTNVTLVDAGTDPNVRAYVQTMIQPTLKLNADGGISVVGSRITSGQGVRDGGTAGTLEHPGIDMNRDGGGAGEVFRSPVAGVVKAVGVGTTNTVVVEDSDGNQLEFLHGIDFSVVKDQTIGIGDPIGTVSNHYTGVSVPPHLHFDIRNKDGKIVSIADYAAEHPIPANIQQSLTLPNGAGTVELAVGQLNVTTAGGQSYAIDLNATNVSSLRFDSEGQTFSMHVGGGVSIELGTSAANIMGGQVNLPGGVTVPFARNGLMTYTDGSIVLSDPQGNLRVLEPAQNSNTGQFVWTDRIMTRDQARTEFGPTVELPQAPAVHLAPITPASGTPATGEPLEAITPTPAPGGGTYWFGAQATFDGETRAYPVSLNLVKLNGVEYQVHPSGALVRDLGVGMTEWRDPDTAVGGITNIGPAGQIQPIARLVPGDVVQTGQEDGVHLHLDSSEGGDRILVGGTSDVLKVISYLVVPVEVHSTSAGFTNTTEVGNSGVGTIGVLNSQSPQINQIAPMGVLARPTGGFDKQMQETLEVLEPSKAIPGDLGFTFGQPNSPSSSFEPLPLSVVESYGKLPVYSKENDVLLAASRPAVEVSARTVTDVGQVGIGLGQKSSDAVNQSASWGGEANHPLIESQNSNWGGEANHPRVVSQPVNNTTRSSESTPSAPDIPTNTNLPITLRGGLIPVLRYGNFAGPGYSGGIGSETRMEHPEINSGKPILVSELTKTPEGLAQLMRVAMKTEPNGYMDSVTRSHDVEYTIAEMRFTENVRSQFDGKLPNELTTQDKRSPAFTQLERARDAEYWQADQRMLTSVAQYQPTDFVDGTYRAIALNAFYTKAESSMVGYGLGPEVKDFYTNLKAIDSKVNVPSVGDSLRSLGTATSLARSDFEVLATMPLTPQERQFFNEHLKVGQYLDTRTVGADGNLIRDADRDSTNRIVVPVQDSGGDVYRATVTISGNTVTMVLDKTNPTNPIFTKETRHNGEIVSTETIRTTNQVQEGETSAREYQSVVVDGKGKVTDTRVIAKPAIPDTTAPPDLQEKLDAVRSGDLSKVLSIPAVHNSEGKDGSDAHLNHYPPKPDTDREETQPGLKTGDSGDSDRPQFTNTQAVDTPAGLSTLPVAFRPPNSEGYTAGPNGSSNRPVSGQPELLELWDSNGGGYIVDTVHLTIVAVLQPGDQVATTSEGRINIFDDNGRVVDRTTEAGRTGVFVTPELTGAPEVLTGSDAHLLNYPATGQPADPFLTALLDAFQNPAAIPTGPGIQFADAGTGTTISDAGPSTTLPSATLPASGSSIPSTPLAPVNTGLSTPDSVATQTTTATTTAPTTVHPPTNANAPDGSDAHFTHYPAGSHDASTPNQPLAPANADTVAPDSIAPTAPPPAGLTAGLSLTSSLINLRNWGNQDDLGHLSSMVGLYNQVVPLSGGTAPLGDLGQFGAGLGVITALQHGNPISIASSGGSLYNSIVGANSVNAIPIPVLNVLNIANALQSGDPFAVASSVASCFPPWGTVASVVISIIGSLVKHDIPEPPQGAVHFEWDATGTIQVQTDQDISKGGSTAQGTANNVLSLLQSVVTSNNQTNDANGQSANNLAIDPSRLPRVGFTAGQSWIEITHPDGSITKEGINPATIGERMVQIALANDALVPVWQIDTAHAHAQTAYAQANQARADASATYAQAVHDAEVANANGIDGQTHTVPQDPNAVTGLDVDGRAPTGPVPVHVDLHHNTAVFGTQGTAALSADHQTQSFGALVVHLNSPGAQQAIAAIKTNDVLHDVGHDGFWEQTQWVAGKDDAGNAQGMLVLDRNNDSIIDTADILHLGGDTTQTNSLNWLDSNGDGKLDASDPAFAAIKVWVDVNNDGRVNDGEMQAPPLQSINFTTGQLNYADGQSHALTTTTLTAETAGSKLTGIDVVGEDGKLHTLTTEVKGEDGNMHTVNLGTVLVHRSSPEDVYVNEQGQQVDATDPHAHVVTRYDYSYDFQAQAMGDWEGTADQAQHRHGGGNVASAPKETSATGASSMGPVLGKENAKTTTTMDVGDKRIISDAPRTQAPSDTATNTTITLNAGDARIRSLTPPDQTARVVFVPAGVRDGWMNEDGKEILQLPSESLFGANGLGLLTAVAVGAVQQTAFAKTDPGDTGFGWQAPVADAQASVMPHGPSAPGDGGVSSTDSNNSSTGSINLANYTVVRRLHLGVAPAPAQPLPAEHVSTYVIGPNAQGTTFYPGMQPGAQGAYVVGTASGSAEGGFPQPFGTLYIAPRAPVGNAVTPSAPTTQDQDDDPVPDTVAPTTPSPSLSTGTTSEPTVNNTITLPTVNAPTNPAVNTNATASNDQLADPLEDAVLHVSFATLLANDTNATTISQVGNATHGSVAIVGGEVVFTPAANYHGPASFAYVVVGQDGSQAAGVADFTVSAVNDVPMAHGETASATEDLALTIAQNTLLANDTDADIATDGQTLRVSAVGHATHGTVSLLGSGAIQFTPDANYHGAASFDYVVNDGNGGTATATATLQVAAVNDVPVALGEVITSSEDTTLLLSQAALLANDTDADVATDGQTLRISAVSNATHGSVSILGNGQIQFVPDANFSGTATFDYVVSDGNGGTANATAQVLVGSTDDAPVASGETVNSLEDQAVTLTAAALLANETDVDNPISSLSIARVTAGAGGSVVLNGSGNVVFTPNANFSGTASFTYWVKDPDGLESNPATVTLNVAPVNDSPYAQGEAVSGASEDAIFHIDKSTLLANDGDEEDPNSALTLAWVGNATNGTVALDGSGNVVFTPGANFNGIASFDYQVRDSAGATSPTVTAQIPVAAVNDNPVGVDEQLTPMYTNTATSPSTATIGFNTLLGNDSDIDNPHSDLTVSGVRNPNNGTVSIVGGAVSFTPTLNFNGTASFEYQVNDQHGGATWATAFISVAPPPNLYPSINVSFVNFYPTGTTPAGAWDIGDLNWTIADDGNTGLVSVTYISGSYHVFGNPGGAVSSLPWNDFTTTQTSLHIDLPRSSAVDAMDTTWRVVDDRGLENIWHFSYSPTGGYSSTMQFTGYAPPVVLALHGDSPHYIETQYSKVRFDLNGDGVADQVAWAAPGSGVLGIDLNGDGRISNANEFTFTQYVPGAKTDLEGLRAFDTNHNGVLDAGDAQWVKFGVWEDTNSDGETQDGEYKTLDQLGINNINLDTNTHKPTVTPTIDGHLSGVAVVGESSFTRNDGTAGKIDDAMLAFQPASDARVKPHTVPYSQEAEVMRMALLFNQMCNTAGDTDHSALGFVPIQMDGHWQDTVIAVPPSTMHEVMQGA